jgi:hypothetical protein
VFSCSRAPRASTAPSSSRRGETHLRHKRSRACRRARSPARLERAAERVWWPCLPWMIAAILSDARSAMARSGSSFKWRSARWFGIDDAQAPCRLDSRGHENFPGTLLPNLLPNSVACDWTRTDRGRSRERKSQIIRDVSGCLDTLRDSRNRITKPLYCCRSASLILGPKSAPEPTALGCSSSYGFGTTGGTQAGHQLPPYPLSI